MGINRVSKRGQQRIEVRRRWPDGKTFRRYFPNMTVANHVLAQIEGSICTGTWRQVREQLAGRGDQSLTIAEFSKEYLRGYCQVRNKDVGFKERAIKQITKLLGEVPLESFTRSHAHEFVEARSREVSSATVNRNLAVLKNMLTFAVDRGYIATHPLTRFRMLPEEQHALRVMTLDEERNLVEEVAKVDPVIGAYVAILGETGLRKQEGLKLHWTQVDLVRKILTVEESKSGRPRYIPLSEYAIDWLNSLVRSIDNAVVFLRMQTRKPWKDPRGPFKKGKKAAGLDWVSFHDLRHFRATQWLRSGVDIRTVQELLGHSSIQTTMRYLHLVEGTFEAVRAAQARETIGRQHG